MRINGRESANGKLTFEQQAATLTAQIGAFANGFGTLAVGPQTIRLGLGIGLGLGLGLGLASGAADDQVRSRVRGKGGAS